MSIKQLTSTFPAGGIVGEPNESKCSVLVFARLINWGDEPECGKTHICAVFLPYCMNLFQIGLNDIIGDSKLPLGMNV